jgi:hypothetical protein
MGIKSMVPAQSIAMNRLKVLIRIQILEVFPSITPISAIVKIPTMTGHAVKSKTPRRSTGFRNAHKRRKVQPVINDPPIPIASLT